MSNISDIKIIKSVVVTGGTGALGIPLCLELVNKGFKVFVFTRDVHKARKTRLAAFPSSIKFLQWHPEHDFEKFKVASKNDLKSLIAPTQQHESLIEALNGCAAVVHLAGKSMFSKRSSQKEIQDNRYHRIQALKHLTYLIDFCAHKPALFLNASSILFYGKQAKDSEEEEVSESASHGCDFWGHGTDILEKECQIISNRCGVPVVHLRLGFIIDSYSDFLKNQIKKCNANKASIWGSGKQWFPWIHIDDVIGIVLFLITKSNLPELQDVRALNLVSPNPVTFEDFVRNLCSELKVKFPYLKTPEWYLKVKIGKISGFVCKCRKVVPSAVETIGYKFQFLSLQAALRKEITMERRLSITSETAVMSKKAEMSPAAIET